MPGMIVYTDAHVRSYPVAEGTDLKPGTAAAVSTAGEATTPTANAVIAGIVVRDHAALASLPRERHPLPICKRGTVWVTAASAVQPGDDVYVSVNAETAGEIGADVSIGESLAGARWASAAAVGELAKLDINLH